MLHAFVNPFQIAVGFKNLVAVRIWYAPGGTEAGLFWQK